MAQPDDDPGVDEVAHPCDSLAHFRVRGGVVRYARAAIGQHADLLVRQPDAVCGDAPGPEQAEVAGDRDRSLAEDALGELDLAERLAEMDVEAGAGLGDERAGTVEQLRGGERQPLDPETDKDPARRSAVELPERGEIVFQ